MSIVIITGMSGAGKTMALKCLEDSGYYAIDNLPASLLLNLVEMQKSNPGKFDKVALVMDIRGGRSFEHLFRAFDELDRMSIPYFVVFLDAADEVLVRRFSETRRIHPLEGEGLRVADTIAQERKILEKLYDRADAVIDTSYLNIHKLKEVITDVLPGDFAGKKLNVTISSFGYKFGIPLDNDIVLDVRFLPNPFWEDNLKDLCGKDREVVEFLRGFPETSEFLRMLTELFLYLFPLFRKEGKRHVSIGFGCTGGRHRSVAIADEFGRILREKGYAVAVHHRDIDR